MLTRSEVLALTRNESGATEVLTPHGIELHRGDAVACHTDGTNLFIAGNNLFGPERLAQARQRRHGMNQDASDALDRADVLRSDGYAT